MVIKKKEVGFHQLELDSPTKKKEKDPKIGRIWVAVGLLLTIGLSGIFWLIKTAVSTDFSGVKMEKITTLLPKIDLSFSEEKPSFGLSQDSAGKLVQLIEANLADKSGDWSVKVTDLNTGFSVQRQSEKRMALGSLIKLPAVALAYRLAEEGKLSLEDNYETVKKDVGDKNDSIFQEEEISLERLLFLSLNQPDNIAFNALKKILKDDLIQKEIDKIGMNSTVVVDNITSAEDIDLFFQKLYKGEITKAYKDDFINSLVQTDFETRIPAGVPKGVRVAHKTSSEMGVYSDAGIVFVPEKPFVLTILCKGGDQYVDETIAELTEKIYWFVVSD
jgi:beta-lactamase class A